jgi:hypothetical protein
LLLSLFGVSLLLGFTFHAHEDLVIEVIDFFGLNTPREVGVLDPNSVIWVV